MQDSQKGLHFGFFVFFCPLYIVGIFFFFTFARREVPTGKNAASGHVVREIEEFYSCATLDSSKERHCPQCPPFYKEKKKRTMRACSCLANVSTLPDKPRESAHAISFLPCLFFTLGRLNSTDDGAAFSKFDSQQQRGSVSIIQLDQQLTDNQVKRM